MKGPPASKPSPEVLATATTHVAPAQATTWTVDRLYREFALTVARWAARLGGGLVDENDVTQDVFLKVERELKSFRGEAKISTWLFQLTVNVVRSRRRTETFRRLFRAPEDDGRKVADQAPLAFDALAKRDARDRLHRTLNRLKERDRVVLVLFEMEERSGQEIAELMGAKPAQVWVWLTRARAAFAREFARVEAEEARHD